MGFFDSLTKESYTVECERCGEELVIERKEVEEGKFPCPACGYEENDIPDHVLEKYQEKRAEEERKRKEKERREKEKRKKEKRRREEKRKREERKRKEREQRLQKERERKETLQSGTCPECGGELEVTQEGYQTGKGAACCLLAGPVGLLGGLMGSGNKTRVCKGCGEEFSFNS